MFIASKFLPALALAVALFPLAAHARPGSQPAPAYQAAQTDTSRSTTANTTPVYSNHLFPDSFGG
jgi:hypothetical protein